MFLTIDEADVAHNVPVDITNIIAHFLHVGKFFGSSACSRVTSKGSLTVVGSAPSGLPSDSGGVDRLVSDPRSGSTGMLCDCFSVGPERTVCEVLEDMKAG